MRLLAAFLCATVLLSASVLRTPLSLAQTPDLLALLPSYADVGSDVVLVSEQSRTLAEDAETFNDPAEAIRLLTDWGWQANASCHYEALQSTGAEAPYLFAGVWLFRDAGGAKAAMPYIIQDLAAVLDYREIPAPTGIGDEARQFIAPTDGGTDLSLYVRSGALVMRVSVLLSAGDPIADPEQIAALILERFTEPPTPTPAEMTAPGWDLAPLLDALPPDVPACFRRTTDERIDFSTMSQRFPGVPDAPARLTALGWQSAVHREFRCDPLPDVGLNWLDMSVHLFQDAAGASAAVPFFADARTVGTQLDPVPALNLGDATAALAGPSENGNEYTLYLSTGQLLFRVSAIAAHGSPQPIVEDVMTALYRNTLDNDRDRPSAETPSPVPTATQAPIVPSPTPTQPPPPTATAAPTVPPLVPTQTPTQVNCDPSYPDVCIPPVWEVGDLDCPDVPYGSFRVTGNDPHNFDGPYDGSILNEPDGIGCEWN
jgi:hypothetical protein